MTSLYCAPPHTDILVDCGAPGQNPTVPGIRASLATSVTNTLKGATFTMACDDNTTPTGSSTIGATATEVTCLDTGVWDYGSLVCAGKWIDLTFTVQSPSLYIIYSCTTVDILSRKYTPMHTVTII